MQTTLTYLIKELEKIENHTITTDNVIFLAKALLPHEKDQMVDMANTYHNALKERGIKTMSGEELFEQLYVKETSQ